MKKILFASMAAFAIIGISTLTGCKKQDQQKTIPQMLAGKWSVKTAFGNYNIQGVTHKDTTNFTADDYFDFKADGTLSIMANRETRKGNWIITNSKLFITNTKYIDYVAGFEIAKLTATSLQLHYIEVSVSSSLEQTYNLSR